MLCLIMDGMLYRKHHSEMIDTELCNYMYVYVLSNTI